MKNYLFIFMITILSSCSKKEEAVPLANEDLSQIIVCTDNTVYALDTEGKIVWNSPKLVLIKGSPFIKDGLVYVPNAPFIGLNITDGTIKRTFKKDVFTNSNILIKDNILLADELRAYNLESETKIWDLKNALYSRFTTFDENVFIMNYTDYKMLCLERKTGKIVWEKQLTQSQGSGPFLHPVMADGLVVAYGKTRNIIAFDSKTGNQMWEYVSEDNTFLGQLSYLDNMIFINKQKEIVAIDAKNGKKIWAYTKKNISGGTHTKPFVLGNKVIIVDGNQCVALNKSNGEKIWGTTNQSNYGISTTIAHKNTVYFNDEIGYICALDIETGKYQWRTKLGPNTYSFYSYTAPILITQSGKAIYPY